MSQLNLCSRREAEKLILQSKVRVNGETTPPLLGTKVFAEEMCIEIDGQRHGEDKGDTVILNKPRGYVSGQEEHNNIPAVRLLTRKNIHVPTRELKDILHSGKYLNFGKRFHDEGATSTLLNYAPAGRLDIDSTGLLLFTKNGVVAKNVLAPGHIDKEYEVTVAPVHSLTRHEVQIGFRNLPRIPVYDLSSLLRGGMRLWNEQKPLKPLLEAEWISEGKDKNGAWNGTGVLRLVLQEGKKRQIRRMCREVLGLHVVDLKRTRIGALKLGDLPEGNWRPLTQHERASLLPVDDVTLSPKQ
jgi:23S rRNA pseudouridine2604 synthase